MTSRWEIVDRIYPKIANASEKMYDYHHTETRTERLSKGLDHCDTPGPVYDRARFVFEGRISDPERGGDLTTTSDRRLIYAVSAGLRIHVGFDGIRGAANAVKHETLFHNAPVAAAGEMEVLDGIVVRVNDRSGSYGTFGQMLVDRRMPRAVLTAFLGASVPMEGAVLDFLKKHAGI